MQTEDIDYLCVSLNIEDMSICNHSEQVYPEDFSQLISERFEPPYTKSRYIDFQHVFSGYQTNLRIDEKANIIVSRYDLNQDGNWDLVAYFEGNIEKNTIMFITFRGDIGF